MSKDWYIQQISIRSSRNGDLLLILMDENDVNNLQEITLEQAKYFYERVKHIGIRKDNRYETIKKFFNN